VLERTITQLETRNKKLEKRDTVGGEEFGVIIYYLQSTKIRCESVYQGSDQV